MGLPISSVQFSSVAQSCPTLWDPMNRSTPGLPVHHQLPESTQTHVHWVGDAIQPSYPLSSPSPPALNLSQHQGLFKWVSSLHQMAKVSPYKEDHIKSLPAMQESQETQVQSLGQEDPLEEGMATQSSILAWRIPWTEEPGRLQSTGSHNWSDLAHMLAIILIPRSNFSSLRSLSSKSVVSFGLVPGSWGIHDIDLWAGRLWHKRAAFAGFMLSHFTHFHGMNRMQYDWSIRNCNCLHKPLSVLPWLPSGAIILSEGRDQRWAVQNHIRFCLFCVRGPLWLRTRLPFTLMAQIEPCWFGLDCVCCSGFSDF